MNCYTSSCPAHVVPNRRTSPGLPLAHAPTPPRPTHLHARTCARAQVHFEIGVDFEGSLPDGSKFTALATVDGTTLSVTQTEANGAAVVISRQVLPDGRLLMTQSIPGCDPPVVVRRWFGRLAV